MTESYAQRINPQYFQQTKAVTAMNHDDIIRMALEHFGAVLKPSDLEVKLAVLAVAAEREACAKACEEQMKSYMSKRYTTDPLGGFRERFAAEQCAIAIRARGEQEQPR